jgi:phosphoglucosamine mutase
VSASHNPFFDNGVKLLARGGRKLTDDKEETVEAEMAGLLATSGAGVGPVVEGEAMGRLTVDAAARGWYCDHVVGMLDGRRLDGMRVVVDCANGAASVTAPAILEAAGADLVEVLSAEPDGTNINAGCGSTDPSALAAAVVANRADVGLALDGDADRVIAVDDTGRVVDGDRLLALFAVDLRRRGELTGDTVVVTVMTNLGFHQAMSAAGVAVHQTPVGDRYVLEALDAGGWALGGEQSGHVIFRRRATTGDGVMTGLFLLDLLARSGRPLSGMAADAMVRLPQVLCNVAVAEPSRLEDADVVWAAVRQVEAELGSTGRVLLRPSGTEKLIRVMVEAPSEVTASQAAERLGAVVAAALG